MGTAICRGRGQQEALRPEALPRRVPVRPAAHICASAKQPCAGSRPPAPAVTGTQCRRLAQVATLDAHQVQRRLVTVRLIQPHQPRQALRQLDLLQQHQVLGNLCCAASCHDHSRCRFWHFLLRNPDRRFRKDSFLPESQIQGKGCVSRRPG